MEVAKMNLHQRIHAIKQRIGYIKKDRKVETYMAVTHDQVTAMTREHFLEFGVLVKPSEIASAVVETGAVTAKGAPYIRFEAKYRVEFINVDDPQDRDFMEITSHALDYGDKSPGKALSYATKYAVMKMLQLETGEDDESRAPSHPGLTESEIKKWIESINAASGDEKTALYKEAISACKDAGDVTAANKIKAGVTSNG